MNITFTLPAPPAPTVFQFSPSPLALGGTSNVWTVPAGVTSVYVDVGFSSGYVKDSGAGDIKVNRVNSSGTVLSTLAVDHESDSWTLRGAGAGSLVRIDVDSDAFDANLPLVTLTFHSGTDDSGPVIARATVQKESRPYSPTSGSASVDEAAGSVTLSWGLGAARLGSNPDHYEVVVPDATNPSAPLYSNLNVDDSSNPTTLTISNAGALGLEGTHTAEVRHCNAAGGCSLPLRITFTLPAPLAPSAPTGLKGEVADRGVGLSWTAPSGVVTGYKVQRRVDTIGASSSTIATLSRSDTSYTDSDAALVEGNSYRYSAIAFNGGGGSPPSDDVEVSFKIISSEWNVLEAPTQRDGAHQLHPAVLLPRLPNC